MTALMKTVEINPTTGKMPIWVNDPVTGETINVEPLLAHLRQWKDLNSGLDGLAFLLIETVAPEQMELYALELKNAVNLVYKLRNVFGRMGVPINFKSYEYGGE